MNQKTMTDCDGQGENKQKADELSRKREGMYSAAVREGFSEEVFFQAR